MARPGGGLRLAAMAAGAVTRSSRSSRSRSQGPDPVAGRPGRGGETYESETLFGHHLSSRASAGAMGKTKLCGLSKTLWFVIILTGMSKLEGGNQLAKLRYRCIFDPMLHVLTSLRSLDVVHQIIVSEQTRLLCFRHQSIIDIREIFLKPSSKGPSLHSQLAKNHRSQMFGQILIAGQQRHKACTFASEGTRLRCSAGDGSHRLPPSGGSSFWESFESWWAGPDSEISSWH